MDWETAYSLAQESVDPWVFVLAQGSAQATEEAKAHCSGQKVAAIYITLLRKPTFLARFQIFRSESSDSVALYSDRASFRPVDGSFRCSSVAGPGRRVRADMRVDFVVDLDKNITTVNLRC